MAQAKNSTDANRRIRVLKQISSAVLNSAGLRSALPPIAAKHCSACVSCVDILQLDVAILLSTTFALKAMAGLSLIQNFLLALSLMLFSSSIVSTECFLPNGTQRLGQNGDANYYKPCLSTTEYSMCCSVYDHCRPDGLCTSGDGGLLWRESCTDRTWKSPSCASLCVSGIGEL